MTSFQRGYEVINHVATSANLNTTSHRRRISDVVLTRKNDIIIQRRIDVMLETMLKSRLNYDVYTSFI